MPKLNVFVACPYQVFPLVDYKAAMSAVGKDYDVHFFFADEKITDKHVLTKITNYIRDSDFCLFDITSWNANVTLELGIALGTGKKHFILFNPRYDHSGDVPSDIKGIDRLQYTSNAELQAKLILLIQNELPQEENRSDSAFNLVKKSVLDCLKKRSGQILSEVVTSIGQDKILVQATLKGMVQSGELKTRGQARGTKYFTADTDMRTISRKS